MQLYLKYLIISRYTWKYGIFKCYHLSMKIYNFFWICPLHLKTRILFLFEILRKLFIIFHLTIASVEWKSSKNILWMIFFAIWRYWKTHNSLQQHMLCVLGAPIFCSFWSENQVIPFFVNCVCDCVLLTFDS